MIGDIPPAAPDGKPAPVPSDNVRRPPEEAAQRFRELLDDAVGNDDESSDQQADAPLAEGAARSAVTGQPVMAAALDDSTDGLDIGAFGAAPRSADRGDTQAEQAQQSTSATDAARFAAIFDRIAAPNGASSETLLTMPQSQWLAQNAQIVQSVRGELSLSLRLNQNAAGQSEEDLRALRRRLEARGLNVRQVTSTQG
jgi:hypothetical protein